MKPFYEDSSVSIYHGDMREVLFGIDQEFDTIIADPPYGETALQWDQWVPGWIDAIAAFSKSMWCFGSMRMLLAHSQEFRQWTLAQDTVWEKHNGSGMAKDRFRRVHEFCVQFYQGAWDDLYHEVPRIPGEARAGQRIKQRKSQPQHFSQSKATGYEYGDDRLQRSVIYCRSCHGNAVHPTQKPTPLLRNYIHYSVPPGGIILDPFCGSGSTGVAAKETGRRAVLIEVDEGKCEIAAQEVSQVLAVA